MPARDIILANDEIYHVINRGITSQSVFSNFIDFSRAVNTLYFYRNTNFPIRYSKFLEQSIEDKENILKRLNQQKKFFAEIIAYCLMPNHFHLLLKQSVDKGISKFIGLFTNSYTRYFNTKNKRKGPLFQGRFKAIRVETDEQLLHLNRYIHLNPYTSYIIKDINSLINYKFSSFPEYLNLTRINFCQKDLILGQFKNLNLYKEFIFNQADYQKKLEHIKHLSLEY